MVFEPAKWVAALRESDPDWSPRCLFRAETGAGAHVGPSGRFAHLGYEAEVYAWILDKLDVTDAAGVSDCDSTGEPLGDPETVSCASSSHPAGY